MTLPLSYSRPGVSRQVSESASQRPALLFLVAAIADRKNLELMMGLEPMTSPLPRECSTTELHQPSKQLQSYLPLPSYRERNRPSMTRKAKNPSSIQVSDWSFPGSIVCQTAIASNPRADSAIHILPLPAGLKSTTSPVTTYYRHLKTEWCTGEDSNLRSA